ncbi:MAG TPA: GrpB family protein [bacterium]|nr:GrpB family protein [bacterium]
MPSKYSFAEYSPHWPSQFEEEARALRTLLGDELLAIHHIGSTSVPGLAAKPTIDLLPLARSLARIDAATPRLQDAGYKAWGEYGLPGRRYFTKDRVDGVRTHNVHIYQFDDGEVERHLAFCAYLRHEAGARREYEAVKREAYARHPADIDAYSAFKDAWIKKRERSAVEWYRAQAATHIAPMES